MLVFEKFNGRAKQMNSSQELCQQHALLFLTAHGELKNWGYIHTYIHDSIYLIKYLFKGVL